VSGGEPFLRKDLEAIVSAVYDHCSPSIINIPTNGILTDRIVQGVEKIARYCKKASIVINVSIDDIGERHDSIRGIPGNYEKAVRTVNALKALGLPNLSVGIHTVLSKFNVTLIEETYKELMTLHPDSYVTEIAEEREELKTIGADITPSDDDYVKAVKFLIEKLKTDCFSKIGRITRSFRIAYYKMVKRYLKEKRQIIPCYAGIASVQIAPDGNVWMCCIKAESMGNLRDADYDLRKIWFSEKAAIARQRIKAGECACPLANAAYTNMLFSIKTLFSVGLNMMRRNK